MGRVHEAAQLKRFETLRALLDSDPALLESEDDERGRRPLHCACQAGRFRAVKLLLDRGADIKALDRRGYSPFMTACVYGHPDIVELLLARGVDPTERGPGQMTGLMGLKGWGLSFDELRERQDAYEAGHHAGVIRVLIEDGRVPVNARDKHGVTAVAMACWKKDAKAARLLLMKGFADLTIPDSMGRTFSAYSRRRSQPIENLLEWYEGEMEKAYLLSKARAVVDDTESITKAPEKAGTQTQAEAQQARKAAAPRHLRGRVKGGEALPALEVVMQGRRKGKSGEVHAWLEYVVRSMNKDLFVELIEGLRHPGERMVLERSPGRRGCDDDDDIETEEGSRVPFHRKMRK